LLWDLSLIVTPTTTCLQDLDKGDSRLFGKARRHYEGLGDRLAAAGAALDVFACSLDQIGLAEMRPAVSDSGVHCRNAVMPLLRLQARRMTARELHEGL